MRMKEFWEVFLRQNKRGRQSYSGVMNPPPTKKNLPDLVKDRAKSHVPNSTRVQICCSFIKHNRFQCSNTRFSKEPGYQRMQQGGLQSSRQQVGKARSIVSCTVVPKERFFICRVRGSHCGCRQEQTAKSVLE